MNTNLKELQELKAEGLKSFPFLTPITDYISKNYDEIESELEESHVDEIVAEILKDHEINNPFAVYSSRTTLKFIRSPYLDTIDNKKKGVANIECHVSDGWRNSIKAALSGLFYISDIKAYEAYLEESRQASAQEDIDNIKQMLAKRLENEEKAKLEVIEEARLREKFGLKHGESVVDARLYEQLMEGDKLDVKFEAFKKTKMTRDEIEEIAYDSGREAYYDYN